jgi:hypothetical protein
LECSHARLKIEGKPVLKQKRKRKINIPTKRKGTSFKTNIVETI